MATIDSLSSEDIIARDRRFVWRPYTSTDDHMQQEPLVVSRTKGAWLYDPQGKAYLDANGSWWVNNLGHNHPRLVQALHKQAQRLSHCALAGITHAPAVACAEALVEVAPKGLQRVFFSDDGSTAVEVALKIAFQYWRQNGAPQRQRFVALGAAFHGETVGAMSVSDMGPFHGPFGSMCFQVDRLEAGPTDADWEHAVAQLETLLAEQGSQIAAVIVEPLLQGAGGMRMWSEALLRRVRELTREQDVFLIADEVFSGLGRTGAMWACDRADVQPDILCTAKGLSGGMLPFAATLTTEAIFAGFDGDKSRALMHGHSFCGNPLGAILALEVLAIYREQDIIAQLAEKSRRIAAAFASLSDLPAVHRPRALGMVGAVDLGTQGYLGQMGWRVYHEAKQRGVYLRPLGDTVYIAPCLTIADDELEQLLDALCASIRAVVCA